MPLPALAALIPMLTGAGAAGTAAGPIGAALASPGGQAALTGAAKLGKAAEERQMQEATQPKPSETLAASIPQNRGQDPFGAAAIKRRYNQLLG